MGLSVLGATTVAAITLVLVLVSLPRLRSFACSANEEDARATCERLAQALGAPGSAPGDESTAPPTTIAEVARGLRRELADAELLDQGACLRRHGYLFALVRVPRPEPTGLGRVVLAADPAPLLAVLAWPWEVGRTGRPAWLATSEGQLFVDRNSPPRWSGPASLPSPLQSAAAWHWSGWKAD